ncbi:recombinase RecU [Bacillus sp. L_1B0_8]|uniref:Holliday junction resolvase RecU n=1 Tax=unclassified Bacillus (in: firmicutes) TaxID=185979 RepID=UPI0005B6F5C4|nr:MULTISPECIES: Holliday junction resolvase RecU [unclassified Bacillus (in: firmicutes)]KIQ88524.1 recombinase RecU [Bacillus sp. L_1B0_5]KIQ90849.1 recombinase RecU [Bacillus sp. L_1B0_8]
MVKRATNYANRGNALEIAIGTANAQYDARGIALIDKVATPVKVKKLDQRGQIENGWYDHKSTVDYKGLTNGVSIAFDAKSSMNKTNFPLKNVKSHQISYLRKHQQQKGVSFLLIEFSIYQEHYILMFDQLAEWWSESVQGGRKSIPYQYFVENCIRCGPGRGIALDYLASLPQVN